MASQVKKYPESVYDFTVKDAKGTDVDLSIFKEKVLLIVNVASKCGMTDSNHTELNQLYEKYNKLGLEILAFPCNQFGAEEPGSNDEISDFVCTRFKSELPIFDKVIPLLRLTLHRLSLLEIMELAFASITQVVVVDFNKWALDCFGDYI